MITNEMIVEWGPIGEWRPTEDPMSGTITFESPNHPYVIMATPHWVEDNMVPIDYLDENEDYHHVRILQLNPRTDILNQMSMYREAISKLIKSF
jgi:hypothetical protein